MTSRIEPFTGFPDGTARFLAALSANNDRDWFASHKAEHEASVVRPARAFIVALGARLREFAPDVTADPRVNGSLFRQNRDTRFSADKRPFKTHLGMWFWEGEQERMGCSGFYVHVEPPMMMVAAGLYQFPKPHLEAYRASLAHPRHGPALLDALDEVRAAGPYEIWGEHYKRVPPGYDVDDPALRDLLRYNGLTAGLELPAEGLLTAPDLVDRCAAHHRAFAPLHRWLLDLTRRLA